MDDRSLWDRQPWDTRASFNAFQLWLLQEKRPRSLDAAYRQHVGREYRASGTLIRASQTWRRWYQAKDKNGERIIGSDGALTPTWPERADAYDEYVAEQARLDQRRRRREIIDEALARALAALGNESIIGEAKLSEIVALFRAALDQSRAEYGDLPAQDINIRGMVSMTADDLAVARDAVQALEQELLDGRNATDTAADE